ncbi:hypothetical protein H8S37_04325 [Mediterraneibacter sp. NSJ-55]|uniref:Uncharacterized protein n=1 Tax=Mediterraneibacter hominis TaxID=2763054 RepID=A0A923LH26_9FIRM|nr:hypothetical protein [Mediterraneibacter hominis]MBC5688159.1 hypothetical protein [Mediterraneibacter hominis]
MERLIDKFAEKVLKTTESFMVESGNCDTDKRYHFFIQCNVGKARYVYGEHSYRDEKFHTDLDLNPKLVAIVADDKIYIVDEFELDIYRGETELPENIFKLIDIVIKENEYVKSVIFADFYKSLKENDITGEELLKECKDEARRILFVKNPVVNESTIESMFNQQDIANSLCGVINLELEAVKRLESKKENWIYKKSYNKKVKELVENRSVVKDYEVKIAEGIRSVDAKTVSVEFELNGRKEFAKMNPHRVIRCMMDNDYFSAYDFETTKRGYELIRKLDAATWRGNNNGKEVLTCRNITKITYKKKELYIRK